ncbi:putative phage abortive infection protein, partial [Brevibacillus sp. SIMBA_076]
LDSRHPVKKGDEGSYRSEVAKREINAFFDESIYDEKLEGCFSFLTGHQIISRYMRVLYHLLKFVRENGDFNGSDPITFQKNYTSPLRSTIRNDVLLLIAVNALNVRD